MVNTSDTLTELTAVHKRLTRIESLLSIGDTDSCDSLTRIRGEIRETERRIDDLRRVVGEYRLDTFIGRICAAWRGLCGRSK